MLQPHQDARARAIDKFMRGVTSVEPDGDTVYAAWQVASTWARWNVEDEPCDWSGPLDHMHSPLDAHPTDPKVREACTLASIAAIQLMNATPHVALASMNAEERWYALNDGWVS
ncbi:hypothetical protein [Desertimonas flava]|uniref:hypothetical protein n=1 Tax=Desertimonas flava TaxID=2064846 RepID=UPI000E355161|nr:hypothetical protein [Desertimonas flava]